MGPREEVKNALNGEISVDNNINQPNFANLQAKNTLKVPGQPDESEDINLNKLIPYSPCPQNNVGIEKSERMYRKRVQSQAPGMSMTYLCVHSYPFTYQKLPKLLIFYNL